jgi:hypothetical protein
MNTVETTSETTGRQSSATHPIAPVKTPRFTWVMLAFALSALLATIPLAHAESRIVNINASVSGCGSNGGACDNAADHLPPGAKFHLISPVNVTLDAGSYRISYAGSKGRYKGWRINGSAQWVWNFGIAVNIGRGNGQLLYAVVADGIYRSVAELTASNGAVRAGRGGPNSKLPVIIRSGGATAYTDILTLKSKTKLSFFVLDYDVSDNAGGVSLRIETATNK